MAGDSNVLVQYNGGDLRITAILFLILTGLSVGLRTYVRGFMTNSFQADDWLMLVAQVKFLSDTQSLYDPNSLTVGLAGEFRCILHLHIDWCRRLWLGTS